MVRQLKHHEQRLLKKTDFLAWTQDANLREVRLLRRYHIQDREDYVRYNRVAGMVTALVAKLRQLPPESARRAQLSQLLLDKLFRIGLVDAASSLAKAEHLPASAFCRRRLPVGLRMAQTMREAVAFVERGDVRVGPETVTDPALLVPRAVEDFVTWVDSSHVRRSVAKYNDKLDDYELLGL